MVDDTRERKLTLEERVQRLEITSLYRSVTRRLIEIYDEQRQHATDGIDHGDSAQPSLGEKAVHGQDGAVGVKEAARSLVDQETLDSKQPQGKNRISACRTSAPGTPSRLIRVRDAPTYLGMDKNRFSREVRPYMTEIPIGKQGIGFDRLDLDAWVDQYKDRNGRPGKKGVTPWDARKSPASSTGKGRGTSTRLSEEDAFAKALAKAKLKRRKNS